MTTRVSASAATPKFDANAPGRISALSLAAVVAQLCVVLLVMRQFQIESAAFLRVNQVGYRPEDRNEEEWAAMPLLDRFKNHLLCNSLKSVADLPRELDDMIAWGPGPRASQSLMLAVRARALIDGRLAPSVDDVLDLAEPVLKHRMALTFQARAEGRTIPDVIRQLKTRIG